MFTRTKFVPVLCNAALALALVIVPYKVTFVNHVLELHAQTAWAKDGGKGGGNNGNGGGNNGGNGGNSGNGGDKGGGNDGNNGNGGNNNGGKGGSNAGGEGGNNGNGSNGDKSGGNSGDKGGGNSGDKGSDGKNNSAGTSGNVQGGQINHSTPAESVTIDGSAMEVRHWNGMSERIKDGRYVMKDAKGRTIINRAATSSDQSRLQSFVH